MSYNVIVRYVDKGSGKDTSLVYLDCHFVPAPPVWLRKKIQRDTGATGIMKIKAVIVETKSRLWKAIVVNVQ